MRARHGHLPALPHRAERSGRLSLRAMKDERLPAAVEAAGLIRRAEASGDFAAIIKRGDPDRGALLLMVSSRGRHVACLERIMTLDGGYCWQVAGPGESAGSEEIRDFLTKRTRFD